MELDNYQIYKDLVSQKQALFNEQSQKPALNNQT